MCNLQEARYLLIKQLFLKVFSKSPHKGVQKGRAERSHSQCPALTADASALPQQSSTGSQAASGGLREMASMPLGRDTVPRRPWQALSHSKYRYPRRGTECCCWCKRHPLQHKPVGSLCFVVGGAACSHAHLTVINGNLPPQLFSRQKQCPVKAGATTPG